MINQSFQASRRRRTLREIQVEMRTAFVFVHNNDSTGYGQFNKECVGESNTQQWAGITACTSPYTTRLRKLVTTVLQIIDSKNICQYST